MLAIPCLVPQQLQPQGRIRLGHGWVALPAQAG
jgi:hypothetical protein